ncbi:MAG: galactofuranosyltransferase [Prevotella sp.]|jgi:hypothetical protein
MTYRLCFISRNYRGIDGSGNKAKTDNETTLRQMGAHNLGLGTTYYNSKILTFFLDLVGIIKMMLTIKPGDIVVLQYPVKKYFAFICNFAHLRHARTIALIHDLGSMRRKKLTIEQEIKRLIHTDYVIASNEKMQSWLSQHGLTRPVGALQLFDYRSKSVASDSPRQVSATSPRLVYAGALAPRKNSFLLKMQPYIQNYQLEIYGNESGLPGLKGSDKVHLHGFINSEDFIGGVKGDFGFVWDGDSVDTCSGNFGEYLRWNSPHKVSFYLRAGLPVIIWKEAAVAPIIEKEGAGFAIGSIEELSERLKSLSADDIQRMRDHVMEVSNRLRSGHYFTAAVRQALAVLTQPSN